LLQVDGVALKGSERTTQGLLRAGIWWFAYCVALTDGDERRAIAIYMTGNPKTKVFRAAQRRWDSYQQILKKSERSAEQ
jgi:hypothetical protein